MVFGFNLIIASVLRGFQILFGLVIFGLSIMLVNDHNLHGGQSGWPRVPIILPLAIAIGALSVLAAVFSLVIAWTNYLREYVEMAVDVVVVLVNIVGGVILAIKLEGKNCSDKSDLNKFGPSGRYPYHGGLASIDILNGGCRNDFKECWDVMVPGRKGAINQRCQQSQADAVFMFLTVVVLLISLVLTFLRMKRST